MHQEARSARVTGPGWIFPQSTVPCGSVPDPGHGRSYALTAKMLDQQALVGAGWYSANEATQHRSAITLEENSVPLVLYGHAMTYVPT